MNEEETNEYGMQFACTPIDLNYSAEDTELIHITFYFNSTKSEEELSDWQDKVRIFAEKHYSTCDLGMAEEGTFSFHMCDLNDTYVDSLIKIRDIYEYALKILPK